MKSNNHNPPRFGVSTFVCPHCSTYAQQDWMNESKLVQSVLSLQMDLFLSYRAKLQSHSAEHIEDFLTNQDVKHDLMSYSFRQYCVAECISCRKISIWVDKEMVYPHISSALPPTEDMPEDVKELYEEARQVQTFSARASAALLRLALEQLTVHLGETTGTLYERIGNLKKKGLSENVIRSLDIVRITANEGAAHAGQIDLTGEDNQQIVDTLFFLVNHIVEETITKPREINEAFNDLPEAKKDAIKDRDSAE